jgi:hypothetical protein
MPAERGIQRGRAQPSDKTRLSWLLDLAAAARIAARSLGSAHEVARRGHGRSYVLVPPSTIFLEQGQERSAGFGELVFEALGPCLVGDLPDDASRFEASQAVRKDAGRNSFARFQEFAKAALTHQ